MIRNYSKLVLQINSISIAFMFLYGFCLFENAFSIKHWDRESITVSYDKAKNVISIKFEFIDYEFGENGEHAYLESMTFCYLKSKWHYEKLMECEVKDQINAKQSKIDMKNKLKYASIHFFECALHEGIIWDEDENMTAQVNNTSNKCYLTMGWHLLPNQIVESILVWGKWRINGVRCCEEIAGEVYEVPYESQANTEVQTASKQKYINDKVIDQPENNNLKVYKEADSVVIKGADPGENIKVYSTTGTQINTTIATDDLVKIKLSADQIYIVQIGQSRYKVAM